MQKNISRNEFIRTTGLVTASLFFTPPPLALPSNGFKIKAIAFDAFPIFDPRPIFNFVYELVQDKGKQLVEIWQARQFSYQWLRVSANKYKNFWDVSKDALDFAIAECGLNLSEHEKDLIISKYESIHAWPDAMPALQAIKKEGLMTGFLSNMTAKMLNQGIQNSSLNEYFDFVISTDEKQTYKPSQSAYQMAIERLKFRKEEILFVPFAAWDMAGAKWFGYPTFWVNRLNTKPEKLDAEPDGMGSNLSDLVEFVRKFNKEIKLA